MSKKKSSNTRPNRDPDHYSKRGVPYWWNPEFVRGTSADVIGSNDQQGIPKPGYHLNSVGDRVYPCPSYGRIHAVKENGDVNLYMKAKDGNLSYIQGSIQREFKKWHLDRQVDYILLGLDPDEIVNE